MVSAFIGRYGQLLAIAGCAKKDENLPQAEAPPNATNANYGIIRVFYATDRKTSGLQQYEQIYSGERSDNDIPSLGTLDVSIPRDHKIGEIERPSIWCFEFREDPEKHLVLLNVAPKSEPQFFTELSARVAESAGKEAS